MDSLPTSRIDEVVDRFGDDRWIVLLHVVAAEVSDSCRRPLLRHQAAGVPSIDQALKGGIDLAWHLLLDGEAESGVFDDAL